VETEGAEKAVAGAAKEAVDIAGAAAVVVDTEDGSGEGGVPEDTVWPEADDDSAAAARMLIRKLFTGTASIPNRFRGREIKKPGGRKLQITHIIA
jgi:hypothetical protein